MKRTSVQFDEDMYEKLRQRASEQKKSLASVVRELVAKGLNEGKRKKYRTLEDFSFVGSGFSKRGRLAPISERHDAALAEIYRGGFKWDVSYDYKKDRSRK